MTDEAAKTERKQRGRPFQKGVSGNPAGRPQGSRHKSTLLAERLMGGRWENVIDTAYSVAVNDRDPTLIKALLDRGWPIRRGAPIEILDLPLIRTLTDANAALAAIVKQMAEGQISPEEAASAAAVIGRAIEAIDLKDEVAAAVAEKKEGER